MLQCISFFMVKRNEENLFVSEWQKYITIHQLIYGKIPYGKHVCLIGRNLLLSITLFMVKFPGDNLFV